MNGIFVQHPHKSTLFFVAIDYYTIFYFFLQLSLDIFFGLTIMIVKRAENADFRGGQKPVSAYAEFAFEKEREREKIEFLRRKQL